MSRKKQPISSRDSDSDTCKRRNICGWFGLKKVNVICSARVGIGAMFLLALLFFQLMTSAHAICVWQQGDGVRVACGFKQSGLLRLRNFGGVKSWAGLGFSVGDEDGFKESLTNVERAEAESRAFQDKGVFSVRETRAQDPKSPSSSPYIFYLNEDENSDEIPEDSDRKRRYGNYDDVTATSTSTTPNPAEKINNSFEKRSSQDFGKGTNGSASANSISAPQQQHNLKKMTVSVNIPEFQPIPVEFELSSVKVGSNEKDTVDKYLNLKPTTTTTPAPKINLSKFYKKPVQPKPGSNGNGRSGGWKKPFRFQLVETTQQIADGFKYNSRRGADKLAHSRESTLLVPAATTGPQPEKLSKALLQQHVKKPLTDAGDSAAFGSSPVEALRRQLDFGGTKPSIRPSSMPMKDVEKYLLNGRRNSGPPTGIPPNLLRMNAPPPGNRRSYPREKRPHHGPPPPPNFPRNHHQRKPGGPPRNQPRKPEPTAFSKQKSQGFHGPPPSDNSVRLPLAVLRKYLPKTFSWPGRNNPHGKRPQMHGRPPHPHRKNDHRPPRPGDSHASGSINHHQRRPQNHHAHVPPFPSDPKKTVVLPVPVNPTRPVGPPRSPSQKKHQPSPFAPSPSVHDDYDTGGWRPGPPPDMYFRQHQQGPSVNYMTPTAITISSPPPSVITLQHPASEKESILHALKTLSQAKADVIKSIVKEGSLPQGVINISSNNETSAKDSDSAPPSPTMTPLPAILPMILPTGGPENQQQESIQHYQQQHPGQFASPTPMYHTSGEYYAHGHDPAHYEDPHEQTFVSDEHVDVDGDGEGEGEPAADDSELFTEKINSISAKLSELPDNEEFITLPIDDVLSMLLATTKPGMSEEKSREYMSTYFGGNKDLQGRRDDGDDDEGHADGQTELGKILYDMGIIHRIAAGNLTVPQMAIVNKLIDLNQNERELRNGVYEGEGQESEGHNVYAKKPPAKYILPTASSVYTTSRVRSEEKSSHRSSSPPRYTTITTTTTTTTPAPSTKWPPSPPTKSAHDYSYHRNSPKKYGSNTNGRSQSQTHLKSEHGTIIDEKVKAALSEYNSKQLVKNLSRGRGDSFSKRQGQVSHHEHEREYSRDRDYDRVSSSKSKYGHSRENRPRSSSSSMSKPSSYSERRSPLYEREYEEPTAAPRPSSSRKRVLGRTERKDKDQEEHVVIIRPSPSRRRQHSYSSSSSSSSSGHKDHQRHRDRSQQSAPSSPVLVDLDSIF